VLSIGKDLGNFYLSKKTIIAVLAVGLLIIGKGVQPKADKKEIDSHRRVSY